MTTKRRTPAEVARLEGEFLHLVQSAGLSGAAALRHLGLPPSWSRSRQLASPPFAAALTAARATARTEASTQDWKDPDHATPIEFPPTSPEQEAEEYDWLLAKPHGRRKLTDGGMRLLGEPRPCGELNGESA